LLCSRQKALKDFEISCYQRLSLAERELPVDTDSSLILRIRMNTIAKYLRINLKSEAEGGFIEIL
jgi:hypothetical protein